MAVPISDDTAGAIKAALERRKKELKLVAHASVILVAGEPYDRARLAETLASLKPVPVLVYAGSATAYGQYLSTQKAVWAAHERGPKQLGCSFK
jgi:ribosomal protein L30E